MLSTVTNGQAIDKDTQAKAISVKPQAKDIKVKPQVKATSAKPQTIGTSAKPQAKDTSVRPQVKATSAKPQARANAPSLSAPSDVPSQKMIRTGDTGAVDIEATSGSYRLVTGSQGDRSYHVKTPSGALFLRIERVPALRCPEIIEAAPGVHPAKTRRIAVNVPPHPVVKLVVNFHDHWIPSKPVMPEGAPSGF
jgi:hypothetical protein